VRERDANAPVSELRTMEAIVASSVARHRFTTMLLGGLAGLAVSLAAVGIYGVVAYSVAQRRYEFGVRMALGAKRSRVFGLVLSEGLGIVVIGLVVGIGGVVVLSRLIASMLVGVGQTDPVTLVSVALLLMVLATIALLIPARRAMSVDPLTAIRGE
jgi:putative ABC transport system permease protein